MSTDLRARVLIEHNVSRETAETLDLYVAQLKRWQTVKNLVGPATLSEVWHRHIADALQLFALAPDAKRWLDLGSGAGIPGLILAIAGGPDVTVDLVESNARKCAFLSEAARLTGARARGHRVVGGLGMLLYQAIPGFSKWFGTTPAVTPELYELVAADVRGS